MIRIYPSILSADFSRLKDEIEKVESAGADGIHLDVMDGHFVPNITFGPPVVKAIRPHTRLPLLAHLMIEQPSRYIDAFCKAGADGITIHLEIDEDIESIIGELISRGIQTGLALNPETEETDLLQLLPKLDRVLVMTVHPGFGGQSFMPGPLEKMRRIRHSIESSGLKTVIEVDGGIDPETAPRVVEAGASELVAGSAIFHAPDTELAMRRIRKAADKKVSSF